MEWKKDYSVGITSIDDEHREIVKMISKLQNSLHEGLITDKTGDVIKEIVNYTRFHFTNEEKFMEQIHFPELLLHRELHHALTNTVIDLLKNLKYGKKITSVDLIEFLKHWLIEHIMQEDKKIGVFYEKKINDANNDILSKVLK